MTATVLRCRTIFLFALFIGGVFAAHPSSNDLDSSLAAELGGASAIGQNPELNAEEDLASELSQRSSEFIESSQRSSRRRRVHWPHIHFPTKYLKKLLHFPHFHATFPPFKMPDIYKNLIPAIRSATQFTTSQEAHLANGLLVNLRASEGTTCAVTGMTITSKTAVTQDGVQAWDLQSSYMERTGGAEPVLPKDYTTAMWVYWRSSDSGWRTLFRGNQDHVTLVQNGNKNLGFYSNRNGGFKDSGYDITNDMDSWQLVVTTGEGDTATSNSGGTCIYTGKRGDSTVTQRGCVDRVASGVKFYRIGWPGQGPGYVAGGYWWSRILTKSDMDRLVRLGPEGSHHFGVGSDPETTVNLSNSPPVSGGADPTVTGGGVATGDGSVVSPAGDGAAPLSPATSPAHACCMWPFPEGNWGADVSGDITKFEGAAEGAQGLSFTVSAGDYFNFNAATPKLLFRCADGATIKNAFYEDEDNQGICASLPISDESEAWHGIGFEGSPTMTVSLFGFEFDLLGEMQSWQEMDDNEKAKLETTKQKIGNAAANIPDPGENALCLAFQSGLFLKTGCAVGFAFAQSGFLVAECSLSPPSAIVCPAVEGAPTVSFEILNFGFSPLRDLRQEALIAFWNGDGTVAAAVTGDAPEMKGVLCMMGTIGFSAFDFELFSKTYTVGATMTVAAILDIKLPSFDDIKAFFVALARGDLSKLMTGVGLPGFQFTVSGEVTLACDLDLFEFEFSAGSAGLSLGFNMDSEYPGFSNGLYMAATSTIKLTDVVPPLDNDFFKCNGRNVFTEISGSYSTALYMSTTAGMGYGFEFSVNIIGNTLDVSVLLTHEQTQVTGNLAFSIGSTSLELGLAFGATYNTGNLQPFVRITKSPGVGTVVNALQSAVNACLDWMMDKITGWFGLAHEQFVQWKNARKAAQKAQGKVVLPVAPWKTAKTAKAAQVQDKFVGASGMLSKGKPRKLLEKTGTAAEKTKTKFIHLHHRYHMHHRHHRHHWHHRHILEIIADAWDSAMDWLGDASPSVIFEVTRNTFVLNICEVKFDFAVKAGGSFFNVEYTQELGITVHITIGDVIQKIKDAAKAAYERVKDLVLSAFDWEMRQRYLQAEERELQRLKETKSKV